MLKALFILFSFYVCAKKSVEKNIWLSIGVDAILKSANDSAKLLLEVKPTEEPEFINHSSEKNIGVFVLSLGSSFAIFEIKNDYKFIIGGSVCLPLLGGSKEWLDESKDIRPIFFTSTLELGIRYKNKELAFVPLSIFSYSEWNKLNNTGFLGVGSLGVGVKFSWCFDSVKVSLAYSYMYYSWAYKIRIGQNHGAEHESRFRKLSSTNDAPFHVLSISICALFLE